MNATRLKAAAQKVVDERFKPGGEWDDLKNAITDLANVLESKDMPSSIKDGGPAFPTHDVWQDCGLDGNSGPFLTQTTKSGMTLRDWFAGKALQGLMVRYDEHPNVVKVCAEIAYDAADAMIASRERKEEK